MLVPFYETGIHLLHDIVAELVLDERGATGVELAEEGGLSLFPAVLKHSLDDATAVGMGGQAVYLSDKGVEDEPNVLQGDPLDGFLDDMVSILILDAL